MVPPLADNIVDVPAQMVTSGPALIAAEVNKVTVEVFELTHPCALVPETVYVVVLVGDALTVEPDVELSPPGGDQV
jgi:hypothetical protein